MKLNDFTVAFSRGLWRKATSVIPNSHELSSLYLAGVAKNNGVAHPLPFGLSPHTVLRFLDAVWSDRVIGVALSEFDPGRDRNDQSLSTLVWLLEYLLLKRYEREESGKS